MVQAVHTAGVRHQAPVRRPAANTQKKAPNQATKTSANAQAQRNNQPSNTSAAAQNTAPPNSAQNPPANEALNTPAQDVNAPAVTSGADASVPTNPAGFGFRVTGGTFEQQQAARQDLANNARNTYDARQAEYQPVRDQASAEYNALDTRFPNYVAQKDAIKAQEDAAIKAADDQFGFDPFTQEFNTWFSTIRPQRDAAIDQARQAARQSTDALNATEEGQAYRTEQQAITERQQQAIEAINRKYLAPQMDAYRNSLPGFSFDGVLSPPPASRVDFESFRVISETDSQIIRERSAQLQASSIPVSSNPVGGLGNATNPGLLSAFHANNIGGSGSGGFIGIGSPFVLTA